MPTTSPDGFPYEAPPNVNTLTEPGITLHGGSAGGEDILAKKVQSKVSSIDADISSLQSRVAALESGTGGVGLIPIASGSDSGGSFSVDLTAGGKFPNPPLWNAIWFQLRFDMTGTEDIRLRLNNNSSSFYNSALVPITEGGAFGGTPEHHSGATSWIVGRGATISTNNLNLWLFHTGANPGLINYQGVATRMSDSTVHLYQPTWGALESTGVTLTSLDFFTEGAETFTNAWWWCWGLRMEHPS